MPIWILEIDTKAVFPLKLYLEDARLGLKAQGDSSQNNVIQSNLRVNDLTAASS